MHTKIAQTKEYVVVCFISSFVFVIHLCVLNLDWIQKFQSEYVLKYKTWDSRAIPLENKQQTPNDKRTRTMLTLIWVVPKEDSSTEK
jgi:hypothetical protein